MPRLTRDVKIKTIAFANDVMGLEASVSLLEKLLKNWKDQRKAKAAVYDFSRKKEGDVGRKTKLTPSLRAEYIKKIESFST